MDIYVEELPPYRGLFRAWLDGPDGEILVQASRQPFFDSARVLQSRGISGRLEMWDDIGRSEPRMAGHIEELAKLTIKEGRTEGIKIARWNALPPGLGSSPAAGKPPPDGLGA